MTCIYRPRFSVEVRLHPLETAKNQKSFWVAAVEQCREESEAGLGRLCQAVGRSRDAYYKHQRRTRDDSDEEAAILKAVETIRGKEARVGTRKLVDRLHKHHDTKVGRDRLFDLLRNAGQLVKVKKRFEKTTYSRHGYAVAPNRIKGRTITKPNQVLVCDCTYIRLRGRQFAYLFLVSDAYTRRIVGHHVSRDLSHHSAVIALSKAASWLRETQGVSGQGVIHHSDRGCQYCCHEFLAALRSYGMESSMTDADHCYQNAIAERINGILKDEFNLDAEFMDVNQLRTAVDQAVEVYNTIRTHWSLGLRTPQEMYTQAPLSTQGRCGSEGSY